MCTCTTSTAPLCHPPSVLDSTIAIGTHLGCQPYRQREFFGFICVLPASTSLLRRLVSFASIPSFPTLVLLLRYSLADLISALFLRPEKPLMSSTIASPARSSSQLSSESTATIVQQSYTLPVLFPEIWLLVFPYLNPQDLQSVSLTCGVFRYLAQPLLFSVLDVSPFLLSYNAEKPILRPRTYLERCKERLEYFKLPHIAHGVHHCWISPYTRSGFPMRSLQDDLEPNLIIDTVLNALPLFPNLSTLSWHCIDITPEWWNVIQSLSINKLWLNSSTIPLSVLSPFPSIIHLDLDHWPWEGRVTNQVSIHEERSPGVNELALHHVIQPNVIQSISVPRADTARHLFTVLSQMTYGLRALKVPFSSVTDPAFVLALENCPALESLCILPPSSDERPRDAIIDNLPATTLPSLTKYEGPYSHIMQFSRQPLQNIVLWGFDDPPAVCNPDALVASLSALAETGTADSLRCLKITVVDITQDLLGVFTPFTRLENIVIQSQDSPPKDVPLTHSMRPSPAVSALYSMLDKVTLPPNVRYIKLSTRLGSPKLDITGQEHEAACFMEKFASRHPKIQRVDIGYGIYWTGMYSAVWGRLRENGEPGDTLVDQITHNDAADGGYSSKSSSRDYILSTVVSSSHPLPLGKLTFTEHRRTILFPHDTSGILAEDQEMPDFGDKRFFAFIWMRFRRLFGKSDAV